MVSPKVCLLRGQTGYSGFSVVFMHQSIESLGGGGGGGRDMRGYCSGKNQ